MNLFYTIPQSHCVVIERFGKFSRIQSQGLRFRIPFIERLRDVGATWGDSTNKRGWLIELTEQRTDTPPRQCHTKDNVPVTANASIYWRITDPKKALYEVDILPTSVGDIALNALRANIGTLDLDTILSERQQLNERIASQLSETSKKWGIIFTRIEIQELTTDGLVAQSMVKQMDAERTRRATVTEADGRSEATVKIAEAEKQAAIIRAEGEAIAVVTRAEAEAAYLKRLMEQVGETQAVQILIAQKYLSGFETITKGGSDKVFLPNSFHGLFSIGTEKGEK
jgi:regulator of protease activity HflC (stomatin/prohibitin superfamily)